MKNHVRLSLTSLLAAIALVFVLTACATTGDGTPATVGTESTNNATSTATATTSTSSHHASGPLTSIRMLDSSNGWALTKNGVLKTSDSGVHWQDVTPADAPAGGYTIARGDFMNMQNAWVASVQQNVTAVTIESTTDGGQHWQHATINAIDPAGLDTPHFLNAQEGWLEIISSPGAGSQGAEIFHSTNGGHSWQKISQSGDPNSGLPNGGFKSGISFVNGQTGYATIRVITGKPTDPGHQRRWQNLARADHSDATEHQY